MIFCTPRDTQHNRHLAITPDSGTGKVVCLKSGIVYFSWTTSLDFSIKAYCIVDLFLKNFTVTEPLTETNLVMPIAEKKTYLAYPHGLKPILHPPISTPQ